MKDVLLGIDVGTMGIRSMLYDGHLNEIGKSYKPYPLINLSAKEIEQDADLWWKITKETIADVAKNVQGKIRAISVSSQGIAFVPVDEKGAPLRNAISWLDSRADDQIESILSVYSEQDIFDMTGKRAASFYTLPKILWLKHNEPKTYEKTYKLLLPHDFIIAKLCGEFVTDHSLAAGTMLYDINSQQWSVPLCDTFGIDRDKLPKVCWSGLKAGTIRADIARDIGLPCDVAVCIGGQDQKCAAFGAGIENGIATVSLGTAAAIEKIWSRPYKDADRRIPCFSFLFDHTWVTEGVLNTAAASMRWLKETLFETYTYDQMSGLVEMQEDDRTDLRFYPHLAGCGTPSWFNGAEGVYYGIHLNTTRADLVRALFEGVAMQIKSNLEVMDGADELRVFGGGAASSAWCQIIADVTQIPVKIPRTKETACSGAAMLAGIGCGLFADVCEAAQSVGISKEYIPDSSRSEYYAEKYDAYQGTEKRMWG